MKRILSIVAIGLAVLAYGDARADSLLHTSPSKPLFVGWGQTCSFNARTCNTTLHATWGRIAVQYSGGPSSLIEDANADSIEVGFREPIFRIPVGDLTLSGFLVGSAGIMSIAREAERGVAPTFDLGAQAELRWRSPFGDIALWLGAALKLSYLDALADLQAREPLLRSTDWDGNYEVAVLFDPLTGGRNVVTSSVLLSAHLVRYTYDSAVWVGSQSFRGVRWTADKSYRGARWVGERTVFGTQWVMVKSYRGFRWVCVKTYHGARWVGRRLF